MTLDISKVVKESGLAASTLRFYEEKGLIRSLGRHGIKRYYDDGVVQRLALITLGKNAGLSLDEVGQMLTPHGAEINREKLLDKANEIDRHIKQLTAMREGLRHAAACQAPSHLECPGFLRVLNLSSKKQKKSQLVKRKS